MFQFINLIQTLADAPIENADETINRIETHASAQSVSAETIHLIESDLKSILQDDGHGDGHPDDKLAEWAEHAAQQTLGVPIDGPQALEWAGLDWETIVPLVAQITTANLRTFALFTKVCHDLFAQHGLYRELGYRGNVWAKGRVVEALDDAGQHTDEPPWADDLRAEFDRVIGTMDEPGDESMGMDQLTDQLLGGWEEV